MRNAGAIQCVIGWALVLGFVFTVAMTCLSLVGWVDFADKRQQQRLFVVLVVELVVIGVGYFRRLLYLPLPKPNAAEALSAMERDLRQAGKKVNHGRRNFQHIAAVVSGAEDSPEGKDSAVLRYTDKGAGNMAFISAKIDSVLKHVTDMRQASDGEVEHT